MATEFEMSFTGSSKNLLGAIAVLSEHNINLNTIATAKVENRFVVKFLSGSEEEVRRMLMCGPSIQGQACARGLDVQQAWAVAEGREGAC